MPTDREKLKELVERINKTSNADFVKRLLDPNRKTIKGADGSVMTHRLGYVDDGKGNAVVFPEVQTAGDTLKRYPFPESYGRAVSRGDTVQMSVPEAELFTKQYKEYYPGFKQYWPGGSLLSTSYLLPTAENTINVQVPYAPDAYAAMVAQRNDDVRAARQRYAESAFRDNAKSRAGAVGAYQIMPITYKDYLSRGRGVEGDLLDPEYNRKVRDFAMGIVPRDLGDMWSDSDSEQVRLAKQYAGYNWGAGSLKRYLRKQKATGVDISNSLDWLEGLPKETRDYVRFVALGEDVPDTSKTMDAYRKSWNRFSKQEFPEDTLLKPFSTGGKIHIKPENRGKFTALKKRTGHSASWFKAHGTPAQKKMAVFALNARKWKHGDGGLIERFGVDAVREALKRRNAHIYDGITEETQQMNYEIPSVAAYAAQPPMLYSSQNGLMLQELPAAGIVETAPTSAYRINRESPYQIAVEVPQENVQIPYAIEPSVKNEFFIPKNYQSIVKPMLSQAQQAFSPRDVVGFARPDLTNGEEQQLQFADYAKSAEALGSNKNKLIEQQVNSLKNGEDLREFQKMLLQNGYYHDLPTPTITAKTKTEVTALQQKLIDAGYDLGPKGADGVIGDYTRAAWRKFVKDHPDEAMIEYVADAKIGRRTRAAARLYYEDITKTPAKKQEEIKQEKGPEITTPGLSREMYNNIGKLEKVTNMLGNVLPAHVGAYVNKRDNERTGKRLGIEDYDGYLADQVEETLGQLSTALRQGNTEEIARLQDSLRSQRNRLPVNQGNNRFLSNAEKQAVAAILTSLNGDRQMTYDDYLSNLALIGKDDGAFLGSNPRHKDASGKDVMLYGGRSGYHVMNDFEDERRENGKDWQIVEGESRLANILNAENRIFHEPMRGRLGAFSYYIDKEGNIHVQDRLEATEKKAARGKNDTEQYNGARDFFPRASTAPISGVITAAEYERFIQKAKKKQEKGKEKGK